MNNRKFMDYRDVFQTNSREVEAKHKTQITRQANEFQTNSREVEAQVGITDYQKSRGFQTNSREVEADGSPT